MGGPPDPDLHHTPAQKHHLGTTWKAHHMTDITDTVDALIRRGGEVFTTDDLMEYISDLRSLLTGIDTGLGRAAWGAVGGLCWADAPADERLSAMDMLETLDMTITPAGMTARDALFRQSLAALHAVLRAADGAALTAWIAHINDLNPDKVA